MSAIRRLSSAPRAFTKLLKAVISILRSSGIRVVIYLDDLLILHQNTAELQKIFQLVTNLLMDLGFIMKREKCSPSPTQTIVFLEANLDSKRMTIAVPQDKLNNLQTECKEFVKRQASSMLILSALLGRMNQTARIGIWEAPLYYRALQRLYIAALNKERSLYQIQDSPYSLDKRSIQRIGVVVIEPTNTVLQNDINTPAIRYDHIDRCLQERLGCKLSGSEYRGSVAERRGQS